MKKTLREVKRVKSAKQFDRRDSNESKSGKKQGYADIKQYKNEIAAFKKLSSQERVVQVKRMFGLNLQPIPSR